MLGFFFGLGLFITDDSISLSRFKSSSYSKLAKLKVFEALEFGLSNSPNSLDGNNFFIRGILTSENKGTRFLKRIKCLYSSARNILIFPGYKVLVWVLVPGSFKQVRVDGWVGGLKR